MTEFLTRDIWILFILALVIWQIALMRSQWIKDTRTIQQLINEINDLKRRTQQ